MHATIDIQVGNISRAATMFPNKRGPPRHQFHCPLAHPHPNWQKARAVRLDRSRVLEHCRPDARRQTCLHFLTCDTTIRRIPQRVTGYRRAIQLRERCTELFIVRVSTVPQIAQLDRLAQLDRRIGIAVPLDPGMDAMTEADVVGQLCREPIKESAQRPTASRMAFAVAKKKGNAYIFHDSEEHVIHYLTLNYPLRMSNKKERHAPSF